MVVHDGVAITARDMFTMLAEMLPLLQREHPTLGAHHTTCARFGKRWSTHQGFLQFDGGKVTVDVWGRYEVHQDQARIARGTLNQLRGLTTL